MKKIAGIFIVTMLFIAVPAGAKEIAVLLPVTGSLTPFEKSRLGQEVVEGFSAKFEFQYGEEVDRFVKKAFQDESKKQDCDETNCYRRIAAQYHAEKIVALRVSNVDKDNYLVTINLYDVPTGEMTSSQKAECQQCSFEKLKVLCRELIGRMNKEK